MDSSVISKSAIRLTFKKSCYVWKFNFRIFATSIASLMFSCAGIKMASPAEDAHKKITQAPSETQMPSENSDLQWEVAKSRRARLNSVVYDLKIDLTGVKEAQRKSFSGELNLKFNLSDVKSDLILDFFEGKIQQLKVNSILQPPKQKTRFNIVLPATALKVGENSITIFYEQDYSSTGQGLHRFFDPEDKRVYLYSQFETFDANRFMPCFDQPDLRSTLKLKVVAPREWQVVSAGAQTSKRSLQGPYSLFTFAPSIEIATYLFSLHAGPYAVFTSEYQRADKSKIPLRLMVRQSLKKFVYEKDWFLFTRQGIQFFEDYFATPYPFSKLDQLIAPEFNNGGMENAAAIVYTEWMLPRSTPTRKMRRSLAGLQLHEIAHMWFGDLVTMQWWNDLWLNESFATLMAAKALAEGTEFKEGWQEFAAGTKSGAYRQDVMITTHPIEAPVNTVREAEATFDGITYNKGASALKQLDFYMTAEAFRDGIRGYFKSYSFKNTNLSQFIGALQSATPKNLQFWADRWLRQSGVDQIEARWKCEGQGDSAKLRQIELELKPTPGKKFRPQSFEIGLFNKANSKTLLSHSVRADFESNERVKLVGNWACPQFVYPNNKDHGYIQVRLDAASINYLKGELSTVDDLLVRTMVWNDLWRMVRDTELPLQEYVKIVVANFSAETDQVILQQIANTIFHRQNSILYYWPKASEASRSARQEFLVSMESEFEKRIAKAKAGSDEQKFWFDNYARLAASPGAMKRLFQWFETSEISPKFKLDTDRKWAIATALNRYQHPQAEQVLKKMKSIDLSDRGLKEALSAEAIRPELSIKTKWIQEFVLTEKTKQGSRSLQEIQSIFWALFPLEQVDLKMGFAKNFYEYLAKNRNSEDFYQAETIISSLMPLACDSTASTTLKKTIDQYNDVNPVLKKDLLMSIDEDERCQRVRKTYLE